MTFICSSFCPCFFVFPSTLFFLQFFSPITISQDAAYEIVQLSYYHKLSQCKNLMLNIYNTYTFSASSMNTFHAPHFASMLDIKMNKISVSLFHQSSDWRIELLLDPALGCLRAGDHLNLILFITCLNFEMLSKKHM